MWAGLLFGYRPRDVWEMRLREWRRFAASIDAHEEAAKKQQTGR